MSVVISLLYYENNNGPRTVPWGTPDKTGAQSDLIPFTTIFRNACCLSDKDYVLPNYSILYVQATNGTQVRETGQYLQAKALSPFLKSGHKVARDHSLRMSPVPIDCWNWLANIGPNSEASSFRTLGLNSSGLKPWMGSSL